MGYHKNVMITKVLVDVFYMWIALLQILYKIWYMRVYLKVSGLSR